MNSSGTATDPAKLVVVIGGAPRSGTTLLRNLVGAHRDLRQITTEWTSWNRRDALRRLSGVHRPRNADAMRRVFKAWNEHQHFRKWGVTYSELERQAPHVPASWDGVFLALVRARMAQHPDHGLVLKWTLAEHYARRIHSVLSQAGLTARFLYSVRHPEDAYRSWKHRGQSWRVRTGGDDPATWAAMWLATTGRALELERGHSSRLRVVRFEDLTQRPRATAEEICAFLGLPPDLEAMVQLEGRDANTSFPGEQSEGVAAGVLNLSSRPRTPLAPEEIAALVASCRRRAAAFGYDLSHTETEAPKYLEQDIALSSLSSWEFARSLFTLTLRRLKRSQRALAARIANRFRPQRWSGG